MRRRLNLIILGHVWAMAPLAIAWLLVPAWRGADGVEAVRGLVILAWITAAYLVLRTWLTVGNQTPQLTSVWPYVDTVLITTALVLVRNPRDALTLLYFIPLASAVATLSVPHMVAVPALATVGYLGIIVISATPWSIRVFFRLAVIAIVASLYGWLMRTIITYERAAERVEFQRELAREIHDGVQHLLVSMAARLELAHRLILEAPTRAAQIVQAERETARRAADELRYLVRRLRPEAYGSGLRTTAAHTDLATALRAQVAALADRWPFDLEVDASEQLPRLAPATEHAVLRLIQECITNAAKHAQAQRVEVRLRAVDHTLQCTIRDDGAGFDPAAVHGEGLAGLQERVRSAGGTLQIASTPGHGTTITATFPLPKPRQGK